MRTSNRVPWLIVSSIFLSAHPSIAYPTDLVPIENEERGLANFFGGGGISAADLIGDATSLITGFVAAVKEFHDATNENDLVNLLALKVNNEAEDDASTVTNNTIGAVGANATCPGMAVLFARGTAEAGRLSNNMLKWVYLDETNILGYQEMLDSLPVHHSSPRSGITSTAPLHSQSKAFLIPLPYPASLPEALHTDRASWH